MRHRLQTTFTLIVIWLTASLPLLRGHLPWRGDGVLHVYRLAHLERAVANGDFYPRWLPDLALGYGFPLFNYYAPLSYYLALPFARVSSPEVAIRLSYILALCLTGFAVFRWSRRIWQHEIAALFSSTIAVFSPYILYNIHERGAYAEAWGIAFIAASFATVDALIHKPNRRNWLLATCSITGLLLVHNISALIAAPLLAIYVLWFAISSPRLAFGRGGWGVRVFSAAIYAVGVTTFFWLPALLEQNLVQIGRLTQDPALDFRNHFLTLHTLFALPQSADPTQVNPSIPFGISIPVVILAAYSYLSFPRRRESILLTLTILLLLFLTLPLSQFLWESVALVSFIQFPWRLLGSISLLLAVLAGGAIVEKSEPRRTRKGTKARSVLRELRALRGQIFFTGVLLYGLFWLFPARLQSPLDLSVAGSIHYEIETGALGTTSSADYLPIAVQILPQSTNRRLTTTSAAQIDESQHYLGTAATASHSEDWRIVYEQFYFEGWEATLDGEPLTLFPTQDHGLISAEIPAGTHTLEINWRTTPIRRTSELISIIFVFVSAIFVLALKSPGVQSDARPLPSRHILGAGDGGRAVRVFAIITLIVAITKFFILNNTNNLWHYPRFDGQTVRGADYAADHNFQNALILRGYELPSEPIAGDRPIPLTLFLQSVTPINFNPAISVHLVDEHGRFFGQSDQYRPANFPINRWQPNEYAADGHELQPLPLTPPGTYTLRLFVLNDQSGARLNLLNTAGQPIGNSVDLGSIMLKRGDRNAYSMREWVGQTDELALDMEGALPTAQVGETLTIPLFWGAVTNSPTSQTTQFQLFDPDGNLVATQPFEPLNADFAFDDMREGERWRDPQPYRVPPIDQADEPLTSGNYTLAIAIGDDAIVISDPFSISAPDRIFAIPAMQHAVNAPIADAATLLGYDRTTDSLTLYWQASRELLTNYTRFVHFLDADGNILAQDDAVPGRPTTGWISAEIITDTIPLPIPPAATDLAIGLYDPQSATRLAEPLVIPLK